MTDTFKYKKAAISKEPIKEGDFFVNSSGKVSTFDAKLIDDLLAGKLNAQIWRKNSNKPKFLKCFDFENDKGNNLHLEKYKYKLRIV